MTIFILLLAFAFEGNIYTASFTNGGAGAIQFPSKEACEKKLATELSEIGNRLPDGAKFIALKCVERQVGA